MINDYELPVDRYRITQDDGTTADHQIAGISRQDRGDLFIVQPGERRIDRISEHHIAVGHVRLLTTPDGAVWCFPTNRLADARKATEAELAIMASDYLKAAPFFPPDTIPPHSRVAAMLGYDDVLTVTAEPLGEGVQMGDTAGATAVVQVETSDPKDPAPVQLSASPEPSDDHPLTVYEIAQLQDGLVAENAAPSGGLGEQGTAVETLVVTDPDGTVLNPVIAAGDAAIVAEPGAVDPSA